MFKFYQTELDLDDTKVHSNYYYIGSNFIDFLSTLMGYRMLNLFRNTRATCDWSFKACMDFLEKAKKVRIDDSEEWGFARIPLKDAQILQELSIMDRVVVPIEIKKSGRPAGSRDSKPGKTRADKGMKRTPSSE